jgi:3-methyladenine DNA glycosylase AlkD
MSLAAVRRDIRGYGDPARAEFCLRYFKTAPGDYGHGDRFLGLDARTVRSLAKRHRDEPLAVVEKLLQSPWHEERLVALLILVEQMRRGDRAAILKLYLANTNRINNWDLVDASAPLVVGAQGDLRLLRKLAKSPSLWERRIAIIATQHQIRNGDFDNALTIARILLRDEQDLIHKAVGWMLREIGNRDGALLRTFLDEHAAIMPRTMLRYAIEKFPDAERKRYLKSGKP